MFMKIGVMLDSFLVSVKEGIIKAKELGASGLQFYAVSESTSPEVLTPQIRKEFLKLALENGLVFSAVCGDLGGHGFQLEQENPEKIKKSKSIVDLALDLECRIITTHIGVIPTDNKDPVYHTMLDACRELASYAESMGAVFAVETGPELPETLKLFLDDVGSPGMGVNYDPANLVMVLDADPIAGVDVLGEYIVHTHAKDGIHLAPCDPVAVYGAFAVGGIEGFDFGTYFNEVPLGEGAIDWNGYLNALASIGYDGYLTIEREVGENPVEDIAEAISFLEKKIVRN